MDEFLRNLPCNIICGVLSNFSVHTVSNFYHLHELALTKVAWTVGVTRIMTGFILLGVWEDLTFFFFL